MVLSLLEAWAARTSGQDGEGPRLLAGGRCEAHQGDCLDVLRGLADCSVDSVVTDPPYALVSVVKRFGGDGAAPARHGTDGLYARQSRGFMGKTWDNGDTAHSVAFWADVLRVLKPGGHVVAFAGTRTYHRLACAIEDAGFDVRDSLAYLYGVGFPKSHNMAGEWAGWGTALKPALEPICLARKPLSEGTVAANVLRWGTGALNIDGCRIEGDIPTTFPKRRTPSGDYVLRAGFHQTGEETAVAPPLGRWPANVLHDGSDEVVGAFPSPHGAGAARAGKVLNVATAKSEGWGNIGQGPNGARFGDTGSAARFFYSAKASKADRAGSKHPTVKPVSLMRWLCRLVTPPGGVVLDPFAGTGTTGQAALEEGFSVVLVEREAEYLADIVERFRRMGEA